MCNPRAIRLLFAASLLASLAACGQKGPLYLPEQAREVVTRPADTQAPNTPQTVDSPEGPANPAPEVTAPKDTDPDKKETDATAPR